MSGKRPDWYAIARRPLSSLPVLVLLACLLGCGQRVRCEDGLCPSGMSCDPDSGLCEASGGGDVLGGEPAVFGPFSVVPVAGLRQGFVGRSPDRQSLVWLERDNKRWTAMFIAGPGAGSEGGGGVQVWAAAAGVDGRVHVAFTRAAGSGLWYASRGEGAWTVERVPHVADDAVGDALAVATWLDRPAIAYRTEPDHGLALAWRGADGEWRQEAIAPPASAPGQDKVDLGAFVAMSAWKDGLSVATYDAVGADLVVAVRKAGVWKTGRLAGAASSAGGSGDMGWPGDLARSSSGDLVVAYRDRGGNRVRVLRSEGGKIVDSLVSDGSYEAPGALQTRRALLGTSISLAVLLDGRIAVACQDASRMRVRVFVQRHSGGFAPLDVPHRGRPQAWPRLLVQVDGSLLVAWVEMDPASAPPRGVLQTWTLPPTGALP